MFSLFSLFIVTSAKFTIAAVPVNKSECTDYYWRNYRGTIPEDAISAGNDGQGHPVYIGLAYIRGFELLPATIYPKQQLASTTAYGHVLNTSQNVLILCSPHKEAFVWISTRSEDLEDYRNRNLVYGGNEVGESLFIGRVFRDGGIIIGKIFRNERSNRAQTGSKWDCTDYYWRDYHGTIPDDAIPAGKDSEGHPVYIGLAYIRGFEWLPATIYPKQKTARTTAYANVLNTSQNILCSPHPEAFVWISTKSEDLHDYTDRPLIPGGSEVGENLLIGRIFRDNAAIVGKIFRHERSNRGIWYPYNNGPVNSLTYEVLSYDCEKVVIPVFDVRTKAN